VIHNPNSYGYSIRVPGWRYIEWKHGEAGRELYGIGQETERAARAVLHVLRQVSLPPYGKVLP